MDHEPKVEDSFAQIMSVGKQEEEEDKFPRNYSLTHLWEFDYMASISQLHVNDQNSNLPFNNQAAAETSNFNYNGSFPQSDAAKFQVNPTVFVNPSYELQWKLK